MSKEITLTHGKFATVDDDQYEKLNKYKWRAYGYRNVLYAETTFRINGKQSTILMHRLIIGATKNEYVDHIDGDGLNNQMSNIRICNNSQNQCNRGMQKNNTSGFKGVSWNNTANKWMTIIKIKNKRIYIGYYFCIIKAAKAYNEGALKYHGEFARLNVV